MLQFAKPSFSRSDDLLTMLGAPRTSSRFVSPDGHGVTATNAQIRNGNGLLDDEKQITPNSYVRAHPELALQRYEIR